jgi:uncharacterized membrane protein YgcG
VQNRHLSRLAKVLVAALLAVLVQASPASGAVEDGRITDYRVELTPVPTGDLRVREVITYDFGSFKRHGIYRVIPLQSTWPADTDYNRVWKLTDLTVTQDGEKAEVAEESDNGNLGVRVGDEDKEITGSHVYDLRYTVKGGFLDQNGKTVLSWNATGAFWDVAMDKVTVTLGAGALAPEDTTCRYGPTGARRTCPGDEPSFTVTGVEPRQGVSLDYVYPQGAIQNVGPILEHRVTFEWAMGGHWWAPVLGLLAAVIGSVAAVLHWRRNGRDRVFAGQIPGLQPARGQQESEVIGGSGGVTSVQFTPPAGVRPAELEMLKNETSGSAGMTATLIDLANRGALHIAQGTQKRDKDWRLVFDGRTPADATSWETSLLVGLAAKADGGELTMEKGTDLSGVATEHASGVRGSVRSRDWFIRMPGAARAPMTVIGAAVGLVGVLLFFLGLSGGYASIGVGLVIAAVVMLVVAQQMSARTGAGSAVLAESNAFQRYLQTADLDQIKAEERLNIFHRYLPYAVVFGLTQVWVRTFEPVLQEAQNSGMAMPILWMAGTSHSFDSSFSSFSSAMSSSMSSTSGGTGGSVGGGGGGGGGGSW